MKNIGKYNGVFCYTCTNAEWKDCYNRGQDDGKQIFIIDGVMVRNNKIIGHYDGQHVKDRYDEQPYYVEIKVNNHDTCKKAETADSAEAVSYEEVVTKEICFADYSRVVDELFALLGR